MSKSAIAVSASPRVSKSNAALGKPLAATLMVNTAQFALPDGRASDTLFASQLGKAQL